MVAALFVPGPAAGAGKPDLVVASVSDPAVSVFTGGTLRVTVVTKNAGSAIAAASVTKLYLSKDALRGAGDTALAPLHKLARLRPRSGARKTLTLKVPASAPQDQPLHVVACADATKKVREKSESNNCRVSRATVTITAPTSAQLIDEAVASGTLDAETGLVYEVFDAFGDPRLPSRFEGDDADVMESNVVGEALSRWAGLSTETQTMLLPFVIPPYHEGSWADLGLGSTTARAARAPTPKMSNGEVLPVCAAGTKAGVPLTETWDYFDTANNKVRIWWQERYPGDESFARAIGESIDTTIWPQLVDLMGREPLSDKGSTTSCRGGDDRLDISLADVATNQTTNYGLDGCQKVPAYILLPRQENGGERLPHVAHELMHAIQYSYQVADQCVNPNYLWLMDATAHWVQDYIPVPAANTEWLHGAPESFLNNPQVSLESLSPFPHQYGGYLWPFFTTRDATNPYLVRYMWEAAAAGDVVHAATEPFGADLPHVWKKFARANWNKGPVDTYKSWDGLTKGAVALEGPTIPNGQLLPPLKVTVDHLAAKYLRIKPAKGVTEIRIHNDLAGNADSGLQAIVSYDDGSFDEKDLSDVADGVICINDGTKKATDVVLIFSNASRSGELVFAPEIEGQDSCGCPSATTPRTSRAHRADAALQTCEAKANVTMTFTEVTNEPDYRFNYTGTLGLNLKLKWSRQYQGYYDDGSSFTFTGSGDSWYDRGPNGNCPGRDQIESSWNDSGSGSWDEYGGPSGSVDHDTGTFIMGAQAYRMTRSETTTVHCIGSTSSGSYDWDPVPSYRCPFDQGFGATWTFKLQSETNDTATYAIDCQSETDISFGSGPRHVTVSVKGSLTISKP